MSSRVVTALVALAAFWVMYGVFAILGGRFDLGVALVLAVGALAVSVLDRARRRRRRDASAAGRAS
ncbi:hypothetical protein [Cellulomonas sp. C5510]|uniref:hypothetical protein n=1 Tax=Cellulomonas sp. C5510 TaxID=2871170 RepID=UPI001C949D82|nr:hypothetical protein [Cellulomonas sp. C5510]QZN85391.1 hypothetical protein K5O09_16765 [Cellulomonas sp. C5510]